MSGRAAVEDRLNGGGSGGTSQVSIIISSCSKAEYSFSFLVDDFDAEETALFGIISGWPSVVNTKGASNLFKG